MASVGRLPQSRRHSSIGKAHGSDSAVHKDNGKMRGRRRAKAKTIFSRAKSLEKNRELNLMSKFLLFLKIVSMSYTADQSTKLDNDDMSVYVHVGLRTMYVQCTCAMYVHRPSSH